MYVKSSILIVVAGLALAIPANAQNVKAKATWQAQVGLERGAKANDYHCKISSDEKMTLVEAKGDQFNNQPATPQGPAWSIDLNWTGAKKDIVDRDILDFSVTVTEEKYNQIKISDIYLTLDGKEVEHGGVATLGFKAFRGSSLDFTLYNDTLEDLTVSSLGYMYSSSDVPLSDLIPFSMFGFTDISGSFLIGSGSSMDYYAGDPLPGGYLLMQGIATTSDGRETRFMFEHEDAVPGPAAALPMALGLGLGWMRRRRNR
jgi:hypothetical protein